MYSSFSTAIAPFFVAALFPAFVSADLGDQHGVEAIVAALKAPIPPEMVKEARDFDDKLMTGGKTEGTKVYLVTDERSTKVNAIVKETARSNRGKPVEMGCAGTGYRSANR